MKRCFADNFAELNLLCVRERQLRNCKTQTNYEGGESGADRVGETQIMSFWLLPASFLIVDDKLMLPPLCK